MQRKTGRSRRLVSLLAGLIILVSTQPVTALPGAGSEAGGEILPTLSPVTGDFGAKCEGVAGKAGFLIDPEVPGGLIPDLPDDLVPEEVEDLPEEAVEDLLEEADLQGIVDNVEKRADNVTGRMELDPNPGIYVAPTWSSPDVRSPFWVAVGAALLVKLVVWTIEEIIDAAHWEVNCYLDWAHLETYGSGGLAREVKITAVRQASVETGGAGLQPIVPPRGVEEDTSAKCPYDGVISKGCSAELTLSDKELLFHDAAQFERRPREVRVCFNPEIRAMNAPALIGDVANLAVTAELEDPMCHVFGIDWTWVA